MFFSQAIRNDITVTGQALSVFPPAFAEKPPPGALLLENGDMVFRVRAQGAHSVEILFMLSRNLQDRLVLTDAGDGLFSAVLPYHENYSGSLLVDIRVDGTPTLMPCFPVGWCGNRPCNYVELPEPDPHYYLTQDVPHGTVTSLIFRSRQLDRDLRCLVYLPPDYYVGSDAYPVLYLLNGGTQNELAWADTYKVPNIADNLLACRECVPTIIVMINAMVRFPRTGKYVWDDAPEKVLVNDVIFEIERKFRVRSDKWNRAIAGASMGSYLSNDIGLLHPELFGSIGQFTGCMYHELDFPSYERPYISILKTPCAAEFESRYSLFFRSTTPQEDHFDYFLQDDRICAQAGIDGLPGYVRIVYSTQTSKCTSWRRGIRDFLTYAFKM